MKATVLIVDDEPAVLENCERLLRPHGLDCVTLPDSARFRDSFRATRPDVVLCDLKMPDLDGPGFFQQITRRHPHLVSRVAFLTGDSLSPESHEFIDLSGAPCLAKPFSLGEVYDVIRGLTREMPVVV
ncbi:MAG: response regulator [Gemmatimonadales bacterium]|nr:response regulator [Gemmatimonadales bacterium]